MFSAPLKLMLFLTGYINNLLTGVALMVGIFKWLNEPENQFFAFHAVFILVVAFLAEEFFPGWTIFIYPAALLISVASFMLNYPASQIKSHGLFSEYLIELRLLWLIVLGVFGEYVVYQALEKGALTLYAGAALLVGILILFYSRSHLQEKIIAARGFK